LAGYMEWNISVAVMRRYTMLPHILYPRCDWLDSALNYVVPGKGSDQLCCASILF
jgi:hypothetical protein